MLTVHHLGSSQSERVVWLCEELEIPYELKLYRRSPLLSPPSYIALHPLGAAPVIQDGDLTLAESAACVEWITYKHGNGRFALPPSHKDYAEYLYWWHFSNGTLQPAVSRLMTLKFAGLDEDSNMVHRYNSKMAQYLEHVDQRLAKATWFAGDEFTAADIMSVFTLTTMRQFYPLDLSPYKSILAWLQRVAKREGYQKAMKKGDPDLPLMIDGPPPPTFGGIK